MQEVKNIQNLNNILHIYSRYVIIIHKENKKMNIIHFGGIKMNKKSI